MHFFIIKVLRICNSIRNISRENKSYLQIHVNCFKKASLHKLDRLLNFPNP